jgi:hypothetical protein
VGIEIVLLLARGAVMGVGALLGKKAFSRGEKVVRRRRSAAPRNP